MARLILVAGDLVHDRHIYEGTCESVRDPAGSRTSLVEEIGGAARTERLLRTLAAGAADGNGEDQVVTWLGCEPGDGSVLPSAFATWAPSPRIGTRESAWRVSRRLGFGGLPEPRATYRRRAVAGLQRPTLLVLDDGGASFRDTNNEKAWSLPRIAADRAALKHIVLAWRAPIEGGDLLDRLVGDGALAKKLVVLVSARHLRRAGVHLSRGLSWEQGAEQLLSALRTEAALQRLAKARHLVVSFEQDGALWIDRGPRTTRAMMLFDPGLVEGEWAETRSGEVFGSFACLTTAIAWSLARGSSHTADLASSIARGLSAMRVLHDEGHGTAVDANAARVPPTGFPCQRVAAAIRNPPYRFAIAMVPSDAPGSWSVLASLQDSPSTPPLYGFARQLALRGDPLLQHVPHLRVAGLVTADRAEMESLRALRHLMVTYRDSNVGKKPLSLGVFGAPGSGKSFGVEQLALGVFGSSGASRYEGWLEFNLSQFEDAAELAGALHQVRDRRLQGHVPVVFWDEFDSQEYRWLRHLLAPMQDGRFQEGSLTHTIGKCIFVFAGGTASTFQAFGTFDAAEGQRRFVLSKGPDFKSRLDAYLNVLGPNPAGPGDRAFPIRRAFMIRNLLGCRGAEGLDMDPGVLSALIEADRYTHGARSLGKILEPLATARRADRGTLQRWQLPAADQLALHVVDPMAFHAICERDQAFRSEALVNSLAPAIHETWRRLSGRRRRKRADVAFENLSPVLRRANIAAARRIPQILGLVGLNVIPARTSRATRLAVLAHLDRHLETLAEEEHRGWMSHLLSEGWRLGERRDDTTRTHDCLRPYHELSERDKEADRNAVRHFPDFVDHIGFQIAFR